jgi:SnoaL-like protein
MWRILIFFSIYLAIINSVASQGIASNPDSVMKVQVNNFINEWHKNASEADFAYFDKISESGIYIGTDASELWTKKEFLDWSKKYFESGKAWEFETIERNIYLSVDYSYSWFDELLNTGMGVCRASGLLIRTDNEWTIEHYHLSITIPNESVNDVKRIINK